MTHRDDDERTLVERVDDLEKTVRNLNYLMLEQNRNIDALDMRSKILIKEYNDIYNTRERIKKMELKREAKIFFNANTESE